MHDGTLSPDEIRAWVTNRYYYQTRIPIKDALIVSKSEDRAFRRAWIRRIHDHDDEGGGLDQWDKLADGVGLDVRARSQLARRAPRGALRVRCVRDVRARARAARMRRLEPHRVFRARHHAHAHRGVGEALPVGSTAACSAIFARVPRRRARFGRGARLRRRARDDGRARRRVRPRARDEMRNPVGDARRRSRATHERVASRSSRDARGFVGTSARRSTCCSIPSAGSC